MTDEAKTTVKPRYWNWHGALWLFLAVASFIDAWIDGTPRTDALIAAGIAAVCFATAEILKAIREPRP